MPTMYNDLLKNFRQDPAKPSMPTKAAPDSFRQAVFNPQPGTRMMNSNADGGSSWWDHVNKATDRARRGAEQATAPATPPQPVPVANPAGAGTMTSFGPGENLIGTQFNLDPTTREELVSRMFGAMTPEMDRQAALRRQDLSRRIAGLGRAGMGDVNTSFGNLELQEAQQRAELLGRLTATAANSDIEDMFRRANFAQGERAYQHGLDNEAMASQAAQMAALQSLGFSYDPVQNANLTNALLSGGNAAAQQAAATQGAWGNFGNSIGQIAGLLPFI